MPLTEAHEVKASVSDFVLDLVFLARLVFRPAVFHDLRWPRGARRGKDVSVRASVLCSLEPVEDRRIPLGFVPAIGLICDCGGRDSGLGLSVNLTFAGVPRLLDLASLLVVAWLLFLLCLRFLLEVHSAVDEQVVRPCLCLRRSHDLDLVGSQFVGAAGSAICQQRVDSPMEVVAPCGVPLIVQP